MSYRTEQKLREAMTQRNVARGLEEQAKGIKTQANEVIKKILDKLGVKTFSAPEGTVSLRHGISTRLDRDRIIDGFAAKGIPMEVIAEVLAAATIATDYESVDYRPPKAIPEVKVA